VENDVDLKNRMTKLENIQNNEANKEEK